MANFADVDKFLRFTIMPSSHNTFLRRDFLKIGSVLSANSVLLSQIASAGDQQETLAARVKPNMSPIAIATWNFGLMPSQTAVETMRAGGSVLDAVEKGIRLAESDTENRSVGIGGIPNADGNVQLDACIMNGDRKAGSVAALEGIAHPISVARRIMEQTPHVMLVGDGALKFAMEHGFAKTDLMVDRERQAYSRWLSKQNKPPGGVDPVDSSQADKPENHDTIALLAIDSAGQMGGGCSTSGWGYKLAGRVGDSPIIGSGLYVDGDVGAAGATGLGEIMMRYCGSFLVVEAMRRGATPSEACEEAVRRIVAGEKEIAGKLSVSFIAMAKDGTVGAAGTDKGFEYAVVTNDIAEIRKPLIVD